MRGRFLSGVAAAAWVLGCAAGELELPGEGELQGLYGPSAELSLNGNVVDIRVRQPASQIRRGGELWARVGPYIYLFSPQTQTIFRRWSGVAGVRVRTFATGVRDPVAEALLVRDTLSSVTWHEANRRVARARLDGSRNPGYLEELVRFGEDYARYEYNSRFVRP
ncbi:MAG: hypothetical protein ACE5HP_08675 [Gemmatimonadota bacterium]